MALRKQILKDTSDIPCGSQQEDNISQEDGNDEENSEELSSSLLSSSKKVKCKREKENKSKPKDMTEEEMMDFALRLSEQEASVTALRLRQEEEAMMKAIQESIVSQTKPCPASQSHLLDDAEASLGVCSRRKLLYSNRKAASAIDQGASADVRTADTDLNRGTGGESNTLKKKRKKTEGSPLQEMPDLSQTQEASLASPCSADCLSVPLDSPQSSDSTQIEDCQPSKSPVFPLTGIRAKVLVPRLSQDMLQTCRNSGFVLCSQDTLTSTRESPSAQRKSPTFPKSPKPSRNPPLCRSPLFSDTDEGDNGDGHTDFFKSQIFGKNSQPETSASAFKPRSGFTFSSQDSLTPSVRSTSCLPKSPVFPRSPGLPNNPHPSERSATCMSPVLSETDGRQREQSHGFCMSPVFGTTGQRGKINAELHKHSSGSGREGNSTTTRDPSQSLRQDKKMDQSPDVRISKSSLSEEEISKHGNSAELELTSDMVLLWSEEEDDVTPTGSPSPVFPEEGPLHKAESETASLNHVTAASPGMNCRPSTSPTSSGNLQLVATERGSQPISSEPAERPTVSYYWGVPFCPRGLDPDKYTQVIMAQMEVYEKSLKQAQRFLLRKAEWGGGILPRPEKSPSPESAPESPPQPIHRRRGLRLKGKKVFEEDDSCPAEAEEEDEDKKEEERESKEKEKPGEAGEGGYVDTDEDCEVCPETQLSGNDDDNTRDLMMGTNTESASGCKMSPEPPDDEMILQVDSPAEAEPQEEMEVDASVERNMKVPVSSIDVGGRHEKREEDLKEDVLDADVEEIKDRVLQRSSSPELELATPPSEDRVDCPICQSSFPLTKIERHAAYCNGEVAEGKPEKDCFQVSLKPRRKRTRLAEGSSAKTGEPSNTGKFIKEKCYICQKAVPLRDYSRHTELCIQRQSSNHQSNAAKGNLLSALEQTECRDSEAVPSGSKPPQSEVIDLRDDDEVEEDSVSVLRISNSPIRSFTPISEATGCLIDFRKQHRGKMPRQKRK